MNRNQTQSLLELYWQQGEQSALSELIDSYLYLIVLGMNRFIYNGVPLQGLFQAGYLGLLEAIEGYKEYNNSHKIGFEKYARLNIDNKLVEFVNNNHYLESLPESQLSIHEKVQKFKREFENKYGYTPPLDSLKIDGETDAAVSYHYMLPDDLKELCVTEDMDSFESPAAEIDTFDAEDREYTVNRCLNVLRERDRQILLSYYSDVPLESIANKFGLTDARVKQIIKESIRLLRKKFHGNVPISITTNVPNSKRNDYNKKQSIISSVSKDTTNPVESIGFGFNNQACKIYHKKTKTRILHTAGKNTGQHMPNDYELLSKRLQQFDKEHSAKKAAIDNPNSSITANKYPEKSKAKLTLKSYRDIFVGDKIKYDTSYYTVNATVLDKTKPNRLKIQYDNGIIDDVDFDINRIEVIEHHTR